MATPSLNIDVTQVQAGAAKVDDAKADVAQIPVPASDTAVAGLPGFATADVLGGASQAVRDSLQVAVGRYGQVAGLIRGAAGAYEQADDTSSGDPSARGIDPTLV